MLLPLALATKLCHLWIIITPWNKMPQSTDYGRRGRYRNHSPTTNKWDDNRNGCKLAHFEFNSMKIIMSVIVFFYCQFYWLRDALGKNFQAFRHRIVCVCVWMALWIVVVRWWPHWLPHVSCPSNDLTNINVNVTQFRFCPKSASMPQNAPFRFMACFQTILLFCIYFAHFQRITLISKFTDEKIETVVFLFW